MERKLRQDVFTTKIPVSACAKMFDGIVVFRRKRLSPFAKIEIGGASAKIKYRVEDLVVFFRVKPIFLKSANRIGSRFADVTIDFELLHDLFISKNCPRKGFLDSFFKALNDFLTYCNLICNREGEVVGQENPIAHIVDVKPKVIGVELNWVQILIREFPELLEQKIIVFPVAHADCTLYACIACPLF